MARNRNSGKVLLNIEAAMKKVSTEAKQAVKDVSLDLLGRSKELAPIDTGDLRGSGTVDITDDSKDEIIAEIGFHTPYAAKQHEELDYQHPNGGQAKYLQQPFEQNEAKYRKHIADAIKKGVK